MKKYSKQRQVILDSLRQRRDHPTAQMLYEDVKSKIPEIGIATVYRNVSDLCKENQIQKIRCQDGPDRYDGNQEKHIHFVCHNCQDIIDIKLKDSNLDNELKQLANIAIGAECDKQEIWLSGLCKQCKK